MKISGADEDKIYKVREFISELSKVQDDYYLNLKAMMDTELDELTEEFLFDYVFNSDQYEGTFEEYLVEHGK